MTSRILLAAVVLCMTSAAPAAEKPDRARPGPAPPKPQIACPMIYLPVCGLDKDGRQQNYSNECLAKAAGVTRIERGLCIADITY